MEIIANALNIWWETEHIEEEYLRATVCLIYKKGSTSLLENYRPISLLNSLYKIYAAIMQSRLAKQLDFFCKKRNSVSEKTKARQTQFIAYGELRNMGNKQTPKHT